MLNYVPFGFWFLDRLRCDAVLPLLPDLPPEGTGYPDAVRPSDHLPLYADLAAL